MGTCNTSMKRTAKESVADAKCHCSTRKNGEGESNRDKLKGKRTVPIGSVRGEGREWEEGEEESTRNGDLQNFVLRKRNLAGEKVEMRWRHD